MINRKQAPPIKDAVDYNLVLKPYDHFRLDNGVEVFAVNAGAQEVLQVEWVFKAGNYFESQRSIAAATNYMLKNGTRSRTAFQLNEQFEYYGAYCSRSCYSETAVVNLSTLNKYTANLLPVVRDMITDSVFPEEELAIFKQNSKQRLMVSLKKCDFVAGRLIDAYLFGEDHPYGTYTRDGDLDALEIAGMKSFYKDHYLSGECVIFIAGILPADIQSQLNRFFGDLPLKPFSKEPLIRAIHPAVEKKYRVSNDPEGVQGAIRIARPFPSRHHPDFMKVMLLNNLFGGFFGSRLMGNIREDKGYTYGIHSYLQNHVQQSAWVISTEAGKDVCEATIEEVYKEMKRLQDEPVGEEEMAMVRNYMIGTILGDLDGPFQLISRWKNILLNDLDENYFYESIQTIKQIRAEELMELSVKYLNPSEFYELVVI